MDLNDVKVGIGGWDHEVLDTVLYGQAGLTSIDRLARYARTFNLVEVRPTFWDDSLDQENAKEWLDAVSENPSFTFSVKLHRDFTHKRVAPADLRQRVRGLLSILDGSGHLGALLAQFPFSFTHTSSNRFFLVRLAELFEGFPVHVEVRHSSWDQPSLKPFLREHGIHLVSGDMARVRQLMPFHTNVVNGSVYIRLHGRNEKGWLLNGFDARYDYLYNNRELIELRRRIDTLIANSRQMTVIFNNTTGGKAVANAFLLESALRGNRPLAIPAAALRAFPQLQQIADLSLPEPSLFDAAEFRAVV
jgi:uncharacterized protein YecE (DUF72 family)